MSVVVIGSAELQAIKEAVAKARAKPIPRETMMALQHDAQKGRIDLKDRKQPLVRPQSEHVMFPGGFRASISFEEQPDGLAGHLSISSPVKGRIPNQYAVHMIAEAFGFKLKGNMMWLEEFEPGHHAINIVEYGV